MAHSKEASLTECSSQKITIFTKSVRTQLGPEHFSCLAVFDTGSETNFISKDVAEKLGLAIDITERPILNGFVRGQETQTLGKVNLHFRLEEQGKVYNESFFVLTLSDKTPDVLLGWPFIKQAEMIRHRAPRKIERLMTLISSAVPAGFRFLSASAATVTPQSKTFSSSNDVVLHEWEIEWDLLEYLRQEYDKIPKLNEILVLCGAGVNAECLTCEAYMKQNDPVAGQVVLDALNAALESPDLAGSVNFEPTYGSSLKVEAKLGEKCSKLVTRSQGLDWTALLHRILLSLAAALRRVPPSGGLFTSEAHLEVGVGRPSKIILEHLIPVVQYSCWHSLFPSKVIAGISQTSSHMASGIGLKADLSVLMQLCGTDVPVVQEQGICLEGVRTRLVPISVDPSGTYIQWHLLYIELLESGLHKPREALWSSVPMPKDWYHTKNFEDLQRPLHHFLGWCQDSKITLGTQDQKYCSLRRTNAHSRESEIVRSNTSVNLAFSAHGIGGGITRNFERGRTERNVFENRERDLTLWLISSKFEQVLLHCPSRRQSWLVPKVCVLLHLVLEYMQHLSSEDAQLEFVRPFCEEQSATAQNAFRALTTHIHDVTPLSRSDVDYRLKDLLTTFLHMLDAISRRARVGRMNRTVVGFEMFDLILQPMWFDLKESRATNTFLGTFGGWTRLLREVPIVLFFEGIVDPIIPSLRDDHQLCINGKLVPAGRNYMTTTVQSLYDLARGNGGIGSDGKLVEKAYWHCPDYPFQNCSCKGKFSPCLRLQAIWPNNSGIPPPLRRLSVLPNAALVFAAGMGISEVLRGSLYPTND
jgi:Aspartyl protease